MLSLALLAGVACAQTVPPASPVTPVPVNPIPVTQEPPAPSPSGPAQTSPAQMSPVQTSPEAPAPATPAPATPAPAALPDTVVARVGAQTLTLTLPPPPTLTPARALEGSLANSASSASGPAALRPCCVPGYVNCNH